MGLVSVHLQKQESDFHFRATSPDGHIVDMDDPSGYKEGNGSGSSPMQLLVMAIGGCSGLDVVAILKKSRQVITSFSIDVQGQKPDGVAPSTFTDIEVYFKLEGELDGVRVKRAIELSIEKYCSVARTLEKTARISYKYAINGVELGGGVLPDSR